MAFCSGCWYPVGLYCVLWVHSVWISPKNSSWIFPLWLWCCISTRISPISIMEKPRAMRQPRPARVLYSSYDFPSTTCPRVGPTQADGSLDASLCLAAGLWMTTPTLLRWGSASVPPRVIQDAWRRRSLPQIFREYAGSSQLLSV